MAEGSSIPAPIGATDVFDDMEDGRTAHAREMDDRKFTINFGPQHPAAHGVLRLVLEHGTPKSDRTGTGTRAYAGSSGPASTAASSRLTRSSGEGGGAAGPPAHVDDGDELDACVGLKAVGCQPVVHRVQQPVVPRQHRPRARGRRLSRPRLEYV